MNLLYYLLFFALLGGMFHVLLLPIVSLAGTAIGILLRRTSYHSKARSITFLALYFLFVFFMGLFVVPSYLNSCMWKEEAIAAPTYKFLTPLADTIHSTDHAGKVVVLNFWATWCGPCKKQFPSLEKIYRNYKDNDQVVMLVINPGGRDNYKKVIEFINNSPYDLPFSLDISTKYSKKLDVTSLPTQIIIDKRGVIRSKHLGYMSSENFYENTCNRIDRLLIEK